MQRICVFTEAHRRQTMSLPTHVHDYSKTNTRRQPPTVPHSSSDDNSGNTTLDNLFF